MGHAEHWVLTDAELSIQEGKLAEWWVHECLLSFSINLFMHLKYFIIFLKQMKVQNK